MDSFLFKHVLKVQTIETIVLRFIEGNDTTHECLIEFVPWMFPTIAMNDTLGTMNEDCTLHTAYLSY